MLGKAWTILILLLIGQGVIMSYLRLCSSPVCALPEGAVGRLGKGIIHDVALSHDAKILATATSIGIYLYDPLTFEEVASLKTDASVYSVRFSPDGNLLASGSADKIVKLWDVVSGKEVITFTGHLDHVRSVSFSPDGSFLASGSSDGTVLLWDMTPYISGDRAMEPNGKLAALWGSVKDGRYIGSAGDLPPRFDLGQNYPNPFNPETWIPYQLAKDADVTIRIYTAMGQLVRTLNLGQRRDRPPCLPVDPSGLFFEKR